MPFRYDWEDGYALSAAGEADPNGGPQLTPANESVGGSASKTVTGREILVPSSVDRMVVMPFATAAGGSEPNVVLEYHFQVLAEADGATYTTNPVKVRLPINHTGENKGPMDELPIVGARKVKLTKVVNNTALALTNVNVFYRMAQGRS